MNNRDDWWPRPKPTSRERVLAGAFLVAIIPLTLSSYNNWAILGIYDKPAIAVLASAFFLLVIRPRLNKQPSPSQQAIYAARSIRVFLEGLGDPWDWDDFTSCSFSDPAVDSVRRRAAEVSLPLGDDERLVLAGLAREADELAFANGS